MVRQPIDDDAKWAFAAYRKGAFEGIPEGLNGDDFKGALRAWLGTVASPGLPAYETHVLVAHHDLGEQTPIGFVVMGLDGYKAYPAVIWFPWASNRNRLEGVVRWLHEGRKRLMPVIEVKNGPAVPRAPHGLDRRFMDWMGRYGIVRPVGALSDWWGPGQHGFVYQGQRLSDG